MAADAVDDDPYSSGTPIPLKAESCCCYTPKRYVVVCLMSVGMFIAHAMRVNVAVTVVTILDKTPNDPEPKPAANMYPPVTWDSTTIGLLHSMFYMGYLVTQIPGGYLATILPPHRLFGTCILVSGAFNMLLPITIGDGSYTWTCTVRVIQGLSEGLIYPTCYAVMRHWTTPKERSWMGSIVLTGVYLGPMVGLAVSGAITHYCGWQYVYYVHGMSAVIWFVFWLFLSFEKPAYHPYINAEELEMIEKEQGATIINYKDSTIPWRSILTSMPVHALNVCNFARNWVFYLMITNEPLYVNMFGFSMAENGVYSSLPHALMAIVAICSGPLADLLVHDSKVPLTRVRKAFTGVGFGVECVCFLVLGFVSSGVPALTFLIIGIGLSGFTVSGWQINHLDLAPRHAGVLVAISTTVGTLAGIMIPIITGYLTRNMTMAEWHNVFYLTAAIVFIAVVFYSIFGSGETQPWAEPSPVIQIVNQRGPLDDGKQPYGTFPAQIEFFDKPPPDSAKSHLQSEYSESEKNTDASYTQDSLLSPDSNGNNNDVDITDKTHSQDVLHVKRE